MAVLIFLTPDWLESISVGLAVSGRGRGREVSLQIGAGKPGVHTLLLTIIYLFTVKPNNKLCHRPVEIRNNADSKYQILNSLNIIIITQLSSANEQINKKVVG